MSSAEALVAGVQSADNRKERKVHVYSRCKYCNENHWSDEMYATVEARKQRIKGNCYNSSGKWLPTKGQMFLLPSVESSS